MKYITLLTLKIISHFVLSVNCFGQIMYTIAGNGQTVYNGDSIPGTHASLNFPQGLCLKDSANLLICDEFNHRIRNLDLNTGIITTIAGTGVEGNSGDNGTAISAQLKDPLRVVIDNNKHIYFLDYGNSVVRKIDATTGIITKYAGTSPGFQFAGDGGPAINAYFYIPLDIALDKHNNLYIADYLNKRVRKVDCHTGLISTVAGNGSGNYNGDSILAINAGMWPISLAIDSSDNIYISDIQSCRIRKVDQTSGIITTYAGTGVAGNSGDGGIATEATINGVANITLDKFENLYITQEGNCVIRKIDRLSKIITRIVGAGQNGYNGEGLPALEAKMAQPGKMIISPDNQFYIIDKANNRVRFVDNSCYDINCPDVYTFNGTGLWSNSGNWYNGVIPPSPLPKGSKIIIAPSENGECVLDFSQFLNYGAHFIIKQNKRLRVLSDIIIN